MLKELRKLAKIKVSFVAITTLFFSTNIASASHQMGSAEEEWIKTLLPLGIYPVYPLSQEYLVGDVFALPHRPITYRTAFGQNAVNDFYSYTIPIAPFAIRGITRNLANHHGHSLLDIRWLGRLGETPHIVLDPPHASALSDFLQQTYRARTVLSGFTLEDQFINQLNSDQSTNDTLKNIIYNQISQRITALQRLKVDTNNLKNQVLNMPIIKGDDFTGILTQFSKFQDYKDLDIATSYTCDNENFKNDIGLLRNIKLALKVDPNFPSTDISFIENKACDDQKNQLKPEKIAHLTSLRNAFEDYFRNYIQSFQIDSYRERLSELQSQFLAIQSVILTPEASNPSHPSTNSIQPVTLLDIKNAFALNGVRYNFDPNSQFSQKEEMSKQLEQLKNDEQKLSVTLDSALQSYGISTLFQHQDAMRLHSIQFPVYTSGTYKFGEIAGIIPSDKVTLQGDKQFRKDDQVNLSISEAYEVFINTGDFYNYINELARTYKDPAPSAKTKQELLRKMSFVLTQNPNFGELAILDKRYDKKDLYLAIPYRIFLVKALNITAAQSHATSGKVTGTFSAPTKFQIRNSSLTLNPPQNSSDLTRAFDSLNKLINQPPPTSSSSSILSSRTATIDSTPTAQQSTTISTSASSGSSGQNSPNDTNPQVGISVDRKSFSATGIVESNFKHPMVFGIKPIVIHLQKDASSKWNVVDLVFM